MTLVVKTLKEFLEDFDFSNWVILSYHKDEYDDFLLIKYNLLEFLLQARMDCNCQNHTVDYKEERIAIPNWDEDIIFYLLYIWNPKKKLYQSLHHCFFTKEEALDFFCKNRKEIK